VNIIRRAIEEPLRRIAENAGIDGSIVVDKVKHAKGSNGFNARTEEYEDLIKAGVIDPTKVVRTAIQNAASVASLLLSTEAMVADKPDEKAGGGMPGGMPGEKRRAPKPRRLRGPFPSSRRRRSPQPTFARPALMSASISVLRLFSAADCWAASPSRFR
jgi:hypothetical protein